MSQSGSNGLLPVNEVNGGESEREITRRKGNIVSPGATSLIRFFRGNREEIFWCEKPWLQLLVNHSQKRRFQIEETKHGERRWLRCTRVLNDYVYFSYEGMEVIITIDKLRMRIFFLPLQKLYDRSWIMFLDCPIYTCVSNVIRKLSITDLKCINISARFNGAVA